MSFHDGGWNSRRLHRGCSLFLCWFKTGLTFQSRLSLCRLHWGRSALFGSQIIGTAKVTATPVGLSRRWVEVVEEDRIWRFDALFLASGWECVYGNGCCGIHPTQNPDRADGCCTYGAGITDAEDFTVVSAAAKQLTIKNWQFAAYGNRRNWWKRKPNGELFTRVVKGGCVFLNRPGFGEGPGCALHARALVDGINPLHRKPNVCWQLPLRIDEDERRGIRLTTVRRWERLDFGDEGEPLQWWCTDPFADGERAADVVPAWKTLEPELRALCGDDVFSNLAQTLAVTPSLS